MLNRKLAQKSASGQRSDFSEGKVSGIILRLGLPLMLAELVHVLYSIVDRIYIGRMPSGGTDALTGLSVCFPLITLIGAFANLCSTGGATLCTIARGENDLKKAERITASTFTLLLLLGVFLTALLYVSAPVTLKWLGGEGETLKAALSYFRIYVLGTVPVLISLGMNPFINAQGFAHVGMTTVLIGAVLNTALDPLFIYAFGMGLGGAALATVLSQSVSAVWVVCFLRGKKTPVRLTALCLDRTVVGGMLKLGATGFTFRVTNSITQAAVNIVLKSWGGAMSALYIGAMGLINSLREITGLPTNGLTAAGQSVMSFNYGAKQGGRVSQSIRFVLLTTLAVNTLIWALIMAVPGLLFSPFSSDKALISLTAKCARVYFALFPFMSLQLTGQSTFVALNYPKHALFFSMLRKIVLVLPLTLLLPGLGLRVMGVFWAEVVSQLVGATACFVTMYFVIWKKLKAEE